MFDENPVKRPMPVFIKDTDIAKRIIDARIFREEEISPPLAKERINTAAHIRANKIKTVTL